MGTRDTSSGQVFLPPRPINPENLSTAMEWMEFSGKGVLQAYTIVYIAPTFMVNAGYSRSKPYCVGIIKTEEGPMISAFIQGVDVIHPETINIGTPMKVVFVGHSELENKQVVLAFQPE